MESDWGNEILLSHRKKNRLCSHTRKKKEQSSRVNVVKSSQEEKKKKKNKYNAEQMKTPEKSNPTHKRTEKEKRKENIRKNSSIVLSSASESASKMPVLPLFVPTSHPSSQHTNPFS